MLRLITFICLICSSSMAYTDNDLICMVLVKEAGGEKDNRSMNAVMEVIHNRSKKKNKSYKEIVLEKWQFSCINGIKDLEQLINKTKKHTKWNLALQITRSKPTNFTNGATHYYSVSITPPYWTKKMKFVGQIGNHRFYKE